MPPGIVRELTIPELAGLPAQHGGLRDELLVEARAGTLAEQGRMPVWGALESNTASARLAAKLGFNPVDTIIVFSPAEETWDAA